MRFVIRRAKSWVLPVIALILGFLVFRGYFAGTSLNNHESRFSVLENANFRGGYLGMLKNSTDSSSSKFKNTARFRYVVGEKLLSFANLKNVVIGLAHNVDDESLAIFLGSSRILGNGTVVVVLANGPITERQKDISQLNQAVLVEYSLGSLTPNAANKLHPSSLRWVLFDQFWQLHDSLLDGKVSKVMYSDVRDVAFQADPFTLVPLESSYVFQEGSVMGTPISQRPMVRDVINECFGEKLLLAVQDQNIITGGLSIFSHAQARAYARLLSSVITGKSALSNAFPQCASSSAPGGAYVDQAIHNIVVHLGVLPPPPSPAIEIKSEAEFPVANIASSEIWKNAGMRLENFQVHKYDQNTNTIKVTAMAVLHQYNIISSLSIELSQMYVYWRSYGNPAALWQEEPTCKPYHVVVGKDVYQGQCHIGSAAAVSADQCCRFCAASSFVADGDMVGRAIASSSSTEEEGGHPQQRCFGFYFASGMCDFYYCDHSNAPATVLAEMEKSMAQQQQQQRSSSHAGGDGGSPNFYEELLKNGSTSTSLKISGFL